MKIRESAMLVAMGVGGTLLMQQIKNGNMKKMIDDVSKISKKTMSDLEDMM